MAVVDEETLERIKRNSRLYDAAKERAVSKIQENVGVVIEKLKTVERELLEEVEIEFGENPFTKLLLEINSEAPPTDADIEAVLAKEVPQNFGPNEESLCSLVKEVETFKLWKVQKKEEKLSIPVPSNISIGNIALNSITLTWDAVECASFYQIEVDGSKSWSASTTNTFTKRGLLADTDYTFRIRAVKGNSVSEWSDVVREKVLKPFECVWKECPDDVVNERKYSLDEKNLRVATKINANWFCTVIGSTPLPLNQVASWSVRVLASNNDGNGIYIGVAPSDINQDVSNSDKCGWYFHCCYSTLRSGPPHKYKDRPYGVWKEYKEYVHIGDSVGVVMDTAKGELSFALNGVDHGIAYKGIPLDKPLVPCVILGNEGDSVELVL